MKWLLVLSTLIVGCTTPTAIAQGPAQSEVYSVSDRIEKCARLGGLVEAAIMNPDSDEARKYTLMHQMAQRYDAAGC